MNTLDKVYNLTIDIKNIDVKYNSYAKFFDDDRETSVIRIKLLNDKAPMNLENCIVEAYFILADNTYHNEACKIINSSEGVVELQLCQKCLVKGENIVRLSILKDNEISNTPVITYEVRKGLYSDNPSFNDDPLTPILSQMLLDIKVTKVNQIELQERYEKSLPKIEGKIKEVESLINRVDTVIASGTQDLEVIDARDGEVSLKARLDRDLYKDGISLSDRIEAIEGLKDSQNMKYETDKGYLVCKETKNGVIDDLKIEGKTLVNLFNTDITGIKYEGVTKFENGFTVTNPTSYNGCKFNISDTSNIRLEKSKTYTIGVRVKTNKPFSLMVGYYDLFNTSSNTSCLETISKSGYYYFKRTSLSNPTYPNKLILGVGGIVSGEENVVEVTDILILEGDHTQNPPSYFEGLMSVGQDVDKIEVLSRKEDGNLFDGYSLFDKSTSTNVLFDGINLTVENTDSASFKRVNTPQIKLSPNTSYKLRYKATEITGMQTTKCFVVIREGSQKQTTSGALIGASVAGVSGTGEKEISFTSPSSGLINITFFSSYENANATKNIFSEITLSKQSNLLTNYTPSQSDKKQILFYNENGELEPIQELHEWDSIEKHSDNKWYYHKRSGEVVLDGSEDEGWSNHTASDNYISFMPGARVWDKNQIVVCDKFKPVVWGAVGATDEFIWSFTQSCGICIAKSKLSTQDVEGFKQWLQTNNVTVVYQLAQEEIYELAPLHLDSYANETLILCNSGAISPKMEFSITSHINELVKAYGERINLLEEKVYKYMVTQNRMQLASTYSADSVTFKVDYFSLCGDEENYDEDLYNLILNNILVGKDNYDYDKMFTMILDYASWNQISWEQFDILVGLMDMQHNPPVEELPPEDVTEEDIIENETPVE